MKTTPGALPSVCFSSCRQREVVADTAWPHLRTVAPAAGLGAVILFFPDFWVPYPSVRGDRVRAQGRGR